MEPATPGDDAPQTISCIEDGHLRTDLTGGLRLSLDWEAGELSCEGMRRPDSQGARLRFSGPASFGDEDGTLTFIFGLPDLTAGETANEVPSNVTLVAEGSGRFYATADTDSCWTDIDNHAPTEQSSGDRYRISGTVYCIAPLPALNGNDSVSFNELEFAGELTWQQDD